MCYILSRLLFINLKHEDSENRKSRKTIKKNKKMKNYFIKYSNYFIVIGAILLVMYFLDIVPWKFRNAPELLRWFLPLIFLFVGIAGKLSKSDSE